MHNQRSQRSKISQIIYSGLGGHGAVAFSLVDAAVRAGGIQCHMILYGIEPAKEEYLAHCARYGIPCDAVLKKPGLDTASLREVARCIKRERPDAVLLHSVNLVWLLYLVTRFSRTRLIAIEHQSNQLKTKKDWLYSRLCMMLAHKVIYLTSDYRGEIRHALGSFYREEKACVIPNGLDIDYFSPAAARPPGPTRFGMISRINSLKDHPTLFRAFAAIRETGAELVIAGDGPDLPSLRSLVRDLGIEGQVVFLGLIEGDEVRRFFQDIDVYVHASFGETMSTALMQAMACGLPLIASDVKGIGNMIDQGKTGLLVPSRDVAALSEAMRRLAGDPELAATLGREARAHAVAQFSSMQMLESYLALVHH